MKSEQLLSLIAACLAIVLFGLVASFQAAPQFTTYLLLLLLAAFGFILTEQWKTHDAAEFENRFWTALAFCFSTTCLFCKDSPLKFSTERQGIAWSIVCLCTYFCHIYDRDVRRLFLTRVNFIRKQRSADFNAENRAQAKLKVVQLKKLTATIDQRWVSSTFLNIFFLTYVLSAEDQILHVLSEANRDELNLIINDNHFELALILYKVKDHWVCKKYHRTKLLHLLARERIHDLNVRSRAVLLDSMQRLGVSAQSSLEEFIKNIFISTKGDDLSELKCLMDSKGDLFSMHYLVFVQLRNPSVRQSILDHIAKQAKIQGALLGSMARRRNMLSWRKVLSDIDDTLVSSGGSFPKGVDTNFPKQSIYPGVLAFYRELNLGTSGEDAAEKLRHGDLAFISARPHVYKDVSESTTYNKIRKLQKDRGLHTTATLLAGSLDTGSRFLVTKDSEALAQKKYENFKEYLRIYPEFTCVFVGDNGQGDVRAAELVMGDKDIGSLLTRTYVHVVQGIEETFVRDSSLRTYNNKSRICYFNTYVDAAIDAYESGLIRKTGLQRLMAEAVRDFFMISDDNWGMMNTETIRPRSFYIRKARLAAQAEAAKTASVASSVSPSTADAEKGQRDAGSRGGSRTRSDSFSQAVVSAISSITEVVTGGKAAQNAGALPSEMALTANSGLDGKESATTSVAFQPHATGSSGLVTPPLSSPPLPRKTLSQPSTPATPVVSGETLSQGIAVAKQSLSSNSSTTSSLLSASKSLFGRQSSNRGAPSTSSVVKAAVPSKPNLPAPTLSFSLLDVWEIQRNRPSVYDGPAAAVKKVGGSLKRELRIRELNFSIEHGNKLLSQLDYRHPGKIDPVDVISFPELYKAGSVVSTPFGVGVIRTFRSCDGMYEVLIDQTSLLRSKIVTVPSVVTATAPSGEDSNPDDTPRAGSDSAAATEEKLSDSAQQKHSHSFTVGGSIPASSTFTIRLFVPGMTLSDLKR